MPEPEPDSSDEKRLSFVPFTRLVCNSSSFQSKPEELVVSTRNFMCISRTTKGSSRRISHVEINKHFVPSLKANYTKISPAFDKENILSIDERVRQVLSTNTKLQELRRRKGQLIWILNNSSPYERRMAKNELFLLNRELQAIKENKQLSKYEALVRPILDRYSQLFISPIQQCFISGLSQRENSIEKERDSLRKKYLLVANQFVDLEVEPLTRPTSPSEINTEKCPGCGSKEFYLVDESTTLCSSCGQYGDILNLNLTFKDTDRINLVPRFNYTRRGHMHEAIQKFQGKQNTTIPQEVISMIYDEMDKNSIVPETLTKKHLYLFLSQWNLGIHYENINLIHHMITGKPCPDISKFEAIILQKNDLIEAMYNNVKKPGRKNSMNVYYKLWKICEDLGLNLNREDFSFLKTVLKVREHDEVCEPIFNKLGWYFVETHL